MHQKKFQREGCEGNKLIKSVSLLNERVTRLQSDKKQPHLPWSSVPFRPVRVLNGLGWWENLNFKEKSSISSVLWCV